MPDGDHFHGICVNEFEPDVASEGCPICVTPVRQLVTCCPDCDPQIGFHTELYLRVVQTSTYNDCLAQNMVGDYTLLRVAPCGPWESLERALGQATGPVAGSPSGYGEVCYAAGVTVPMMRRIRIWMTTHRHPFQTLHDLSPP